MRNANQNLLLVMKVYGYKSKQLNEYHSLCRNIQIKEAFEYLDTLAEEILSRRTKLEKIISKISENSSNTL